MCPACHSLEFEIIDLAGDGVVYSYAILHHPQNPAFDYPVLAALIDLDEGVRVLSNLVDVDPERHQHRDAGDGRLPADQSTTARSRSSSPRRTADG